MMHMHNVILVDSLFNVMTAIQLRRRILTNLPVDIILSDLAKGLEEIYHNKTLEDIFDNVYFVKYSDISFVDKIKGIINPNYIIQKSTGYDFKSYSDIFFWNPTIFFHYYLFEADKRDLQVNLHVYGDAMGGFFYDIPLDRGIFRRSFANKMVYKYYHYTPIDKRDYDYYEYQPEYITFNTTRRVHEIPGFSDDPEIRKIFNKVFNFSDDKEILDSVIVLDLNQDDYFPNSNEGIDFINHITQVINKSITLKPHPRQDLDRYNGIDVNISSLNCPWELYCLNHFVDDKLIIAFASSSSVLPYILCDTKYRLVFIDLKNSLSDYFDGKWSFIIQKLLQEGKHISYVKSINEFDSAISKII